MFYLRVSIGIFLALSISRFVPHPPNFTSLIALGFYVPAIFGIRYLPALILSFIITDFIIGFHETALFTWGSVVLIGLISKNFIKNILSRISGALLGALIFYVVTNFGVWSLGSYGYSIEGFLLCYTLALPFFGYTLVSTFIFSGIIEGIIKLYKKKLIFGKVNNL